MGTLVEVALIPVGWCHIFQIDSKFSNWYRVPNLGWVSEFLKKQFFKLVLRTVSFFFRLGIHPYVTFSVRPSVASF